MSKLTLYNGIKAALATVISTRAVPLVLVDNTTSSELRFQKIELWRNNIERENVEVPFLKPAAFIEFLPSNYKELSNGAQSYELIVRIHLVFESYKDEDTDILDLVDKTYVALQFKQYGTFGKLKRRNEEQNFDHGDIQDYMQDYDCGTVMDYSAQENLTAPVSGLDITPEVVTSI